MMSIDRVFNSLANNLDFIRFCRMMVLAPSRSSLFCVLSRKVVGSGKSLVLTVSVQSEKHFPVCLGYLTGVFNLLHTCNIKHLQNRITGNGTPINPAISNWDRETALDRCLRKQDVITCSYGQVVPKTGMCLLKCVESPVGSPWWHSPPLGTFCRVCPDLK